MQSASDLAARLAEHAEAVCRHYLPAGHLAGSYWIVGDLANSKGRSLYVHVKGDRVGRWRDAARPHDFGDLLDLIAGARGLTEFRPIAEEARRFLALPEPERLASRPPVESTAAPRRPEAARRLFAMGQPLRGTLADRYLMARGILCGSRERALRFHPGCYYRDLVTGQTRIFPALLAAVTAPDGNITGVHRTWLDPDGDGKAPVEDPRRAMGALLGNGVRFGLMPGMAVPVLAVGEGLETVLSLGMVMPDLPSIAASSANHLAALTLPPGCERVYIAADADAAGRHGIERLGCRAREAGLLVLALAPRLGDFNEDLRRLGPEQLAGWLRPQLLPADADRFLPPG
ncbi:MULTISPECIES: DUF7146 domain-containing protein [Chelativorans]|jgi:hypothetical protein|uniref:Uncharacterized protein n=1 Tax=Chelativorans sp. (strain BNC1) TaxID=266779 RepID=Q11N08_CHESB|nr:MULTISPECIES: toprim domain-containing protein [Chelativorans]